MIAADSMTGGSAMVDTQQEHAFTLDAGEGRALWHLGALITFKALGAETSGQYWALEGLADSHMAVPLHIHSREDEIWYVLGNSRTFDDGLSVAS
jgi:hypothetical protein